MVLNKDHSLMIHTYSTKKPKLKLLLINSTKVNEIHLYSNIH